MRGIRDSQEILSVPSRYDLKVFTKAVDTPPKASTTAQFCPLPHSTPATCYFYCINHDKYSK